MRVLIVKALVVWVYAMAATALVGSVAYLSGAGLVASCGLAFLANAAATHTALQFTRM